MIKIKETLKMGRGLFALEKIPKGCIVEVSPVIPFKSSKTPHFLDSYVFSWDEGDFDIAMALGLGSLFNHSRTPNVTYTLNYRDKSIKFISCKNIKKGNQLYIDYGYNPISRKNQVKVS